MLKKDIPLPIQKQDFSEKEEVQMNSRRKVINVESREFWLIHKAQDEVRSLCGKCGVETDWLTLDQAIIVTGLNAREIFRRIESGRLHFIENEYGFLFVCAESLSLRER